MQRSHRVGLIAAPALFYLLACAPGDSPGLDWLALSFMPAVSAAGAATASVNDSAVPRPESVFGFVEESHQCQAASGFDYRTSRPVRITIRDDAPVATRYDIFTFTPGENVRRLGSGGLVRSRFEQTVNLPYASEKIYVRRRAGRAVTSGLLEVSGDCAHYRYVPEPDVAPMRDDEDNGDEDDDGREDENENEAEISPGNFTSGFAANFASPEDVIYAVNNDAQVILIDANDFSSRIVGRLPLSGSITNAIDVSARRMYFQQSNDLWYLDMDTLGYHRVGSLPGRWPRMEYNPEDGMLYMGTNETLYIVDPGLSLVLATYSIQGMESPVGGGDLKFGPDGVLYMCAFSGLYRLGDIPESGPVQATRLSAEDLAYNPTSLTVGADGTLYFGENSSDSRLFGMSPVNGDYQELAHYDHKINDLTTLPRDEASLGDDDTDGDGIPDHADDFPEDGELAFQTFTPSEFGYGSLAFEDLWPAKGDYDFNDLVLNYRMVKVANARNEIVEFRAIFKITAIGAAYRNGFGIQLPVAPGRVESVTGANLTTDTINVLDNGVEAGQDKAVIILFDRARDNVIAYRSPYPAVDGREMQLTVRFTSPVPASELGAAPFNPFLIVNGNRGREIHLQNQAPTNLALAEYFDRDDDDSGSGVYYSASAGHPWAIHIIHEFRFPRERISIEDAYHVFLNWVTSRGQTHADWYKDNAGYRAIEKLVL